MKKTYLLAGLGAGILALAATGAYAASSGYEAWRSAMGDRNGRAAQAVTEKNFDRFSEMHRLMAEGKYDEAQKVRTELGLGQGQGQGQGRGKAGGCGMAAGRQGGCGMRGGGGFVDANNNGICDRAETGRQ